MEELSKAISELEELLSKAAVKPSIKYASPFASRTSTPSTPSTPKPAGTPKTNPRKTSFPKPSTPSAPKAPKPRPAGTKLKTAKPKGSRLRDVGSAVASAEPTEEGAARAIGNVASVLTGARGGGGLRRGVASSVVDDYLAKAGVAALGEQRAAIQEASDMGTDRGGESGATTEDKPDVGLNWEALRHLEEVDPEMAKKMAVLLLFGIVDHPSKDIAPESDQKKVKKSLDVLNDHVTSGAIGIIKAAL